MENISLNSNSALDVTIVPNAFIDKYMLSANGAYVKVYLYLLRCLSSSHSNNLSISSIADVLDHTENDIIRALCYWEKVNVLTLMRNPSNQIVDITFNSLDNDINTNVSSNINMVNQVKNNITNNNPTNIRRSISDVKNINNYNQNIIPITDNQSENTMSLSDKIDMSFPTIVPPNDEKYDQITYVAEKLIGRQLTQKDEQLILYLYTKANFSDDMIIELYEQCANLNKKKYEYIEAVANDWIKRGINSVEIASDRAHSFNSYYKAIIKEFGLTRALGLEEKKYIDKWISTYSFEMSVIKEACKRTLLRIQKPDFKYADAILESWNKNNVKTMNDVYELDKNHTSKFNNASLSNKKPVKSTNRFNNFTQRNYSKEDFEELEKRLLNK